MASKVWQACKSATNLKRLQLGRFAPEEKLEAADKGPEIIVPLDLLERVQCKAAKDLESWPGESKKHQVILKLSVSVSEGTDFGQKKNLNQWVYWFMV